MRTLTIVLLGVATVVKAAVPVFLGPQQHLVQLSSPSYSLEVPYPGSRAAATHLGFSPTAYSDPSRGSFVFITDDSSLNGVFHESFQRVRNPFQEVYERNFLVAGPSYDHLQQDNQFDQAGFRSGGPTQNYYLPRGPAFGGRPQGLPQTPPFTDHSFAPTSAEPSRDSVPESGAFGPPSYPTEYQGGGQVFGPVPRGPGFSRPPSATTGRPPLEGRTRGLQSPPSGPQRAQPPGGHPFGPQQQSPRGPQIERRPGAPPPQGPPPGFMGKQQQHSA